MVSNRRKYSLFIFIELFMDEHIICICNDTRLRWMIVNDPQITFNIEKLINTICKSITIIFIGVNLLATTD
jgi:hypothetical protein